MALGSIAWAMTVRKIGQ